MTQHKDNNIFNHKGEPDYSSGVFKYNPLNYDSNLISVAKFVLRAVMNNSDLTISQKTMYEKQY